jgi:siroheme decarboxylase
MSRHRSQVVDSVDRAIINRLQDGIPIEAEPFLPLAGELGVSQDEILFRVKALLESGLLTRFGPLFHAERLGGALTLAALEVPPADIERIAAILADMPEVAHNYERNHRLSMWFVLATETPEELVAALTRIAERTGLPVFNMPKIKEFYVGLRFEV